MIKQISTLTKLQLKNMYGINVLRFMKDRTQKKKKLALAVTYVMLLIMAAVYVGGMTYGYIFLGLSELVPAYLILLSSLIMVFFSIFKAGSVIFQRNAYDILASLPLSRTAIVVSRFLRMYVENLVVAAVVMVPCMVVYGVMIRPGVSFYVLGVVAAVFLPLLPITISTFVGALITAIASRTRHKSLVSAGLSVLLVVGITLGTAQMSGMEGQVSPEMIRELLGKIHDIIESIYPPAIWYGDAMLEGDFVTVLMCVGGSMLLFIMVMALVSVRFHEICRGLYSTGATHDYKMEHLQKSSVMRALYYREWKRYVSSGVYVTNTIIGPFLAVIFACSILVIGMDKLQDSMGIPVDIRGVVPFLLGGIFCVMPTTCTSVSLEGKEWWIVKSLPIKSNELFACKLLMFVSLIAPFYVVSELLLVIALKPDVRELLWLVVIPVVMVVFSGVFGITVNVKLPVFDWENEVAVVKQSASSLLGGIGGMLIVMLCAIPVVLVPALYEDVVKLGICLAIVGVTIVLYRKNSQVNLLEL